MRYAVFTDIHANLEALEAVLAKIDEISAKEPIDQIWFLGDLVGYGPDPNECILKLRARTDVIIAGNHDWAAVGKIDLEEFSPAARISAEWTAEQLTEEHRAFLENLPERLEIGECTLVHGSPYGPLWEYLTREEQALAERSFEYFTSRYCFVGHTHVPVIFQQPDIANTPTMPLGNTDEFEVISKFHANGVDAHLSDENAGNDEETTEMAVVLSPAHTLLIAQSGDENAASAFTEPGGDTRADAQANAIPQEQSLSETTALPVNGEDTGSDESTEYAIPAANVDKLTIDAGSDANQDDKASENQGDRESHMSQGDREDLEDENQGDHKDLEDENQGDRKGRPYNTTTGDDASENEESTAPLFAGYGEESFVEAEAQVEQMALLEADNLPPETLPVDTVDSEDAGGVGGEDAQQVTMGHNDARGDGDETTEFVLAGETDAAGEQQDELMQQLDFDDYMTYLVEEGDVDPTTSESEIADAEERLNGEIEELLSLLGLSQSLISVTNEMVVPPEGHWEAPEGYRAIVNPGGVGQPRDGDPRAAFMIYDSTRGFEFYRIPYDFEKTQEKIINAGLPQFLAVRLQFGR